MRLRSLLTLTTLGFLVALGRAAPATPASLPGHAPHAANPILPGYYADPSVLAHEGQFYLYATLDPWGGDTLGCWESEDFKNWTYRRLNWPTKQACTSPTSKGAMVWAPSVLRGTDGKFHMVVSVGSEVWAGVADHPLGPWRNALGDRPMIAADFKPGFHMIDAELFLDDDGEAYLYWGSGWNWVNGRCWAVKLAPDMATFAGEVRDVTPPNYFEAPLMVRRGDRYFLMYSAGKTTIDTYRVHYAVGASPLGPFTEAANSPILVTDAAAHVMSPGHHTVFRHAEQDFIVYHRHSIPFDPAFVGRQVCVDPLVFTADGLIEKVAPTHPGPALAQGRRATAPALVTGVVVTASSQASPHTAASAVLDDNYATRWAAAPDAAGAWLQLDLGAARTITRQELRFEYAWKNYRCLVEASPDAQTWLTLADFTRTPATGSPVVVESPAGASSAPTRYLRLVFPSDVKGADIALFEWAIF